MFLKKTKRLKIIALITGVIALVIISQFVYPDVSELKKKNPGKTAFMKHREAQWQRERKNYSINQRWVLYDAISPYLVRAVLIGEDDKFWQHEGFDYKAMQKAIEKDIRARKFKLGGSTISQQLAKNLYLSPSKNIVRKFREAIITWRIEKTLSKRRILEIYLNTAEWGDQGIFGIEAAARHYYEKSASELTAEESARLAAVLPNPRKYSPIGGSRYVENRSNLIYKIMVSRGIVIPEYSSEEGDGSSIYLPVSPQNPAE